LVKLSVVFFAMVITMVWSKQSASQDWAWAGNSVLTETMMPRNISLMLLLAASLVPAQAWATPAQVILLRHGDKDPGRGDYNLSPKGFERAIRLGRVIPACFGAPINRRF
jgi:hypothetical protein